MVLADTSVWIDHLRRGNATLVQWLETDVIACHPFVVGEVACGTLRHRDDVLRLLQELPVVAVASDDEVLAFVGARKLMGRGLGWVDVHLLAAATLGRAEIWTLDRRLASAARELKVAAEP